jgi:hypothetical protein
MGPGAKQREYIIEVTDASTPKQSPGAMMSAVHVVLIPERLLPLVTCE